MRRQCACLVGHDVVVRYFIGHAPTLPETWLVDAAELFSELYMQHCIIGRLYTWLSEPLEYLLVNVALALLL